jgi:hypothetical protein
MTARDWRRDCWLGSPLSLRERGFGVRVQSLLNPDAEVKDVLTLTPTLSRRERVICTSRCRLMPMATRGVRLGEVLECSIITEIRQTFVVEGNAGRIGAGRQKLLVTGGGALEATTWSMTGERCVGQASVYHVGQATIHGVGGTGYADVIA